MNIEEETFYWVKIVTILRGAKEPHKVESIPTIGFFDSENIWNIVGSDEIFYTYESDKKCKHRQGYIKPLEKIENKYK